MQYRLACLTLALIFAVPGFALRPLTAQQSQVPGAIRTGITMVPVDVRVIDRYGRPVTDLKQEDFTLLENGVPQTIGHFSATALAPRAPQPGARPEFRSASSTGDAPAAPRNQRVFLIALGLGRLQVPAKGLDGLISLVRERDPHRPFRAPSALPATRWADNSRVQALANIAELTGGMSAQSVYADRAVGRIDAATRFQYLLAYAPLDADRDGTFRRITVKVNRPGVRVLYRHGYYARDQLVPFDRQQEATGSEDQEIVISMLLTS